MSSSRNRREDMPLLQTDGQKQSKPNQPVIKRERELWENEDIEEEARVTQLFAENMKCGASLLFQDTLILVLYMLLVFVICLIIQFLFRCICYESME